MRILGAIIAGGKSSRMGGKDKAFLDLDGVALIERVKSRLLIQADEIVISANGDKTRFDSLGSVVLPDLLPDIATPLAGLHAVLLHALAHGFDAVFSTPCDAPFLPLDVVKTLREAGKGRAIIAASEGQSHYLTGYWPVACAGLLDDAIRKDLRRVQDFCSLVNASELEWPEAAVDPFYNVNSPADLAFAEMMAQL
jgi:molybdenum cofactor guanylyltransferase